MLSRNVGGIDRAVRLVLGLALLPSGLLLLGGGYSHGLYLAIPGILGLATGISRFCILYVPFGISTAHRKGVGSFLSPRKSQLPGRAAGGSGQ